MSTAASGRVICPRCNANNFETQAACWKCGVPLQGTSVDAAAASLAAPRPVAALGDIASRVDPSVAHWVGVIGGLLVPFAMLPVGLAFLMWDDRRKVEVGRTATIASVIGTIVHLGLTFLSVYGLVQQGFKMMPGMAGRAQAAQTEKAPDFNSPVKPPEIPGIPSLSPPSQ